MDYSPAIVTQARQYAYLQLTQRRMAALWGVTEQTVINWKHDHPEFLAAIEKGASQLIENAAKVLSDAGEVDPKFALEILQRRDKETWGDVKRTEHTGADGAAIEFRNATELTDDELATIIAEDESEDASEDDAQDSGAGASTSEICP